MPISNAREEDGRIKIVLVGPWQGIDTKSPPTNTPDGFLPSGLQNVDLPGGTPVRIDGHDLHAASFDIGSSTPTLLARYIPSTGSAFYITADESGQVYSHASGGGAGTIIRRGLSTTAGLWWSHTQLGDYLIITNPTDGNYKWDGTRLIPLGAKYISDMESGEDAEWTGGTVETIDVREGTQARELNEALANGTETMSRTPASPWDLVSGLFEAVDYNTTTDRISFFVHVTNLANIDTTNTYIRFGNAADTAYFQAAASTWGSLSAGWNLVRIARSAFTTTGAPNWNNIIKMTMFLDTNAGGGATLVFDDVYVIYDADHVMPGVQIVSNWKNMVLGAQSTAFPSEFYFSEVSAPDEFDPLAVIPVDENDGTEITTLHPYYNQVLIGKENSVHSLSGSVAGTVYPNFNFEIIRITVEHGCSSHRATIEAKGGVYMWWRGEIHRYNGTGTEKVSTRIDPTLATVNMARLSQIVGARYRVLNQLLWYYPTGSQTQNENGLVYAYDSDSFIPRVGQIMALATTVFEGDIEYLLTAEYDGEVHRQDFGPDFDGTAITARVTYPWLSGGLPDELKAWVEGQVNYQTNTGTLTVEYRIANHPREFDAASFTTAASINMAVVGERGRFFIGERSRWVQIRLSTVGAVWTQYDPLIVWGTPLGAMF